MLRGLYTAASAMKTTEQRIDVISNNMANVNTTGFKKDVVITETFKEVLLSKMNGQLPTESFLSQPQVVVKQGQNSYSLTSSSGFFTVDTPRGRSYSRDTSFSVDEEGYLKTFSRDAKGNIDTTYGYFLLDANGNRINVEGQDFEISEQGQVLVNGQAVANLLTQGGPHVIGTINGGSRINSIETNFLQGSMEETGNPLHFALDGSGFFKVQNLEGETFYTRNGTFTLNDQGELVTSEGYFLLNDQGASIMVDGRDFAVSETGEILVNGEVVDRLALTEVNNPRVLRKFQQGYYQVETEATPQEQPFQGKVLQGYLESSNVNSIKEMVEMISAYRTYESNQKVVRTYDELLSKAVNDIGKV